MLVPDTEREAQQQAFPFSPLHGMCESLSPAPNNVKGLEDFTSTQAAKMLCSALNLTEVFKATVYMI